MPILDVYSYTYERMLWEPKNFELYEEPPMLTDEELVIAIYRRFNEAIQRSLNTLGYIKDIKLRGGYTFRYINTHGTNFKHLYNLIKCDEIVVEPNHTIVFKYNTAWSDTPRPPIDNVDDADIYWSEISEEGKKDLVEATKISNEMLMGYIQGGYMRVWKEELRYYDYIKVMRINSLHTFEYLRRNRIGKKEYYLEPLYKALTFGFITPTFKISVEPNFTICVTYERAW